MYFRKLENAEGSKRFDRRKFIKETFAYGSLLAASVSPALSAMAFEKGSNVKKVKLKPELYGDWWLVGPPPEPDDKIPAEVPKTQAEIDKICEAFGMSREDCLAYAKKQVGKKSRFEPVDHHIFQGDDGYWLLWGCIRGTGLGRILYHWRARNLTDTPWEKTGEFFRCDPKVGECIDDWNGQE